MKLMSEEKLTLESDNKNLILTTHRIRFTQKLGWGKMKVTSIMLESLDACMFRHIGKNFLLITAVLSFIIGLALEISEKQGEELFIIGLLTSIILFAVYFFTRKGVITLYAGSITMNIQVKGMSVEKIIDFIDEIEKAKNDRERFLLSKR